MTDTSEGLPVAAALAMHSRLRFILNLLPLIQNATSLRSIVSVMAATCEGAIDLENISGHGLSLIQRRNQMASIQTLLLEEVAKRAPDVRFVHTLPGVVKSGILRDASGLKISITICISKLLMPLIETSPAECGERHLFVATSARYPPGSQSDGVAAGVSLGEKVTVARATDGQIGSGMYSVNHKGDSAPEKVEQLLVELGENGTAKAVWDYVMADFERIAGKEVAG
jgi:hypothetical protein